MNNLEVFISYSWKEESNKIATEIETLLKANKINVVRDKSNLAYKGLIKEFMDRLGKGKCIILILSEDYLKSENCMYELLQIAKENFYERIFPLVLPGTNIYKATERIKYVHYWEKEIRELEQSIKKGSLTNLHGIYSDLNLYDEIRSSIDKITTVLKNINVLSIPLQQINDYTPLLDKLKSQLEQDYGTIPVSTSGPASMNYFERLISQKIGVSIAETAGEIEKNLKKIGHRESAEHISYLDAITQDPQISREILTFYIHWEKFKDAELHFIRYDYLSINKLVKVFNLNKTKIYATNPGLDLDRQTNEEKLQLLYQYYKSTGQFTFLLGELCLHSNVPLDSEPAVYFAGSFQLSDHLDDHFDNLPFEKDSKSRISIGTAHFILGYSDPMRYPIISLTGQIGEEQFKIAISRKYIPFHSGSTDYLTKMLSGEKVTMEGFGSIDQGKENHYQIQPLIFRLTY